jgi:hypothetical protein
MKSVLSWARAACSKPEQTTTNAKAKIKAGTRSKEWACKIVLLWPLGWLDWSNQVQRGHRANFLFGPGDCEQSFTIIRAPAKK